MEIIHEKKKTPRFHLRPKLKKKTLQFGAVADIYMAKIKKAEGEMNE